ncbi:MAG: hypothetical protein HYW48_05025 [Deltaproteobacteria bacterium]|nr:hypothetical protein [Deltaproteobacteria bacterium]
MRLSKFVLLVMILHLASCKEAESPALKRERIKARVPKQLGQLTCSVNQLALAEETFDAEDIVPVPLEKLTLERFVLTKETPFPGLPFLFPRVAVQVNDPAGSYGKLRFRSLTDSSFTKETEVPSNIDMWVYDLPPGSYEVSVLPCNSLGCREEGVKKSNLLQASNTYPEYEIFQSKLNECLVMQERLRKAGYDVVEEAKQIEILLAGVSPGTSETGQAGEPSSCAPGQEDVAEHGRSHMRNLQRWGGANVAAILSDPDVSKELEENVKKESSPVKETKEPEQQPTGDSFAKKFYFALGVSSLTAGALTFAVYTFRAKAWENLIGGAQRSVANIQQALFDAGYNAEKAVAAVGQMALPEPMRASLLRNFENPGVKDAFNSKAGGRIKNLTSLPPNISQRVVAEVDTFQAFETQRLANQQSFKRGAILGAAFIAAGVTSLLISHSLPLVTGSVNPLNEAERIIDEAFQTQRAFRKCSLELNSLYQAAVKL